jgi:dynein heavy chain 2, cytosolic
MMEGLSSFSLLFFILICSSILSLKASVFQDGNVVFTTNFTSSISYEETSIDVIFYKRNTEPLNEENITHILDVQSLQGSPLDALYTSLKGVWCPALLKNNEWSNKLPPRVMQLLTELESVLGDSNREESPDAINLENTSSMLEPNDEIKFWIALKDNRRIPFKSLVLAVDQSLNEVSSPGFSDLETLDIAGLEDLVARLLDALNSIWCVSADGKVYPQKRMEHFFNCIGGALCRRLQQLLSGIDIWNGSAGLVRQKLQAAIRVIRGWVEVPVRLTTTFWRGSDRPWKGPPHEDAFSSAFLARLEEVLKLRSLAEELRDLLSSEERSSYRLDDMFRPLQDTNPLLYNPYSEKAWRKAVADYERSLDPVEEAVAARFRRSVAPMLSQPQLLLREFQKYHNLLERPTIRRSMIAERESLLTQLKELVSKIELTVDSIEASKADLDDPTSSNSSAVVGWGMGSHSATLFSPRVNNIVMLRQLASRAASALSTSQELLADLDGFPRFSSQCKNLLSRARSEEESNFDTWVSRIEELIEDDAPALRLQGSLMGWKEGVLIVNFSEDLVRFLREVRQLDDLGLPLPKAPIGRTKKSLLDKAKEASKFYRYGILLKKTANFYNSISEQMIDVQENLLLASINAFIDIVSKPSLTRDEFNVSWSNPAECENYIKVLQDAAEKLSSENRSLRKVHESLIRETVSLMNVDLLRQTETWKGKWRGLKERMHAVRSRYSEKDCRSWVLHWDYQIYKALEASYQMMLESLNESLPEIKTELVFVNKRLDFKPPLENIRQSYFSEMKKFVAMPNNFEGFGNVNVFRRMGARNSARLIKVFVRAESLFDKLSAVLVKYAPLVRLGQIHDLDLYIENNVKSPEEYVANFKILKNKRRDIDKLPDVEKVDCCTVSLTPFKGYLDELLVRISDSLLVNLRRSILDEFKEVDTFLGQATERLSTRPHTVDEITEAQKEWRLLGEQKDRMRNISKVCVEKKKLLLLHAPGSAVDVSEVLNKMSNLEGEGGRWDDFDIGMEAFNFMIEDQKEEAKAVLEDEVVGLNKEIDKLSTQWRQLKPKEVKSYELAVVTEVFDSLDEWKKQITSLMERSVKLTESCTSFDLPKPRFDGLDGLMDDLTETNKSWDLLKEYLNELSAISEQDWIGFSANVYELQDFAMKWFEKLKTASASDSSAEFILSSVDKMKKCIPALKYCNGDTFGDDHWTELLQVKLLLPKNVNKRVVKVEHFLSRLDILTEPSTLSFVKALQARAMGEVQIKTSIDELSMWEKTAEVIVLTTEESGRKIPLIKEWKDLFLAMGDKQSLLSSLKESQFYSAFAIIGEALESKMSILDKVLQTLNSIQRKWVYLEPIFGRGALPAEEARFKRVDDDFTDIMILVSSDPKLFNLADPRIHANLADKLRSMLDQLERCQKALADFLEAKRSAMPRFYFIGDDDLLEILGQAKNPVVIQSHLKKLFQGINKVRLNDDNTLILAMISSAGETVTLENPVKISEKVEDWLENLAVEMRETLAALLIKCLNSKSFDWMYPSQILCLAQQVNFTDETESTIDNRELDSLHANLITQLRQFTSIDFAGQPLEQLKMKSLVMDLVHNIDVIDQLRDKHTKKLTEWQWQKQLRYYVEGNLAVVKMADAKFAYTYEYQGNAPKLVHTPLTDKCYLTLTQGMHMGFGGNPYGPAGTGKTESVKALASCMGRQVLVFNCDEGIDFQSMGRIFIGLVKCGAWGCFDEFNRLKEDQLSAISQQIQVIQDAIKVKSSPIHLLGRTVDVDFNAGIFVTLNPAGKGYGGRSRLPDNLKALFRPVAMGRPDNELIAEVNLVTEGFTQSKDLASKIVSLFNLSKQLLSAQQHYDWGLRALKAVLNTGGRLIQSYKSDGTEITVQQEFEILIKAVRVNTLSKLTFSDTSKFLALIGDVFPGIPSADITGGELEEAIRQVMVDKPYNLIEDAGQIKKMIQLKESLDQRMGCVIVGPSGCGKSSLWRVLKSALVK